MKPGNLRVFGSSHR